MGGRGRKSSFQEYVHFDQAKINALPPAFLFSCLPPTPPTPLGLNTNNLSGTSSPSCPQPRVLSLTLPAPSRGTWQVVPGPPKSQLFCSLSEGRPTTLLLLPFTGELSEDSYEEEQIFEEEGSELNSEDSDIQEVLPVPNTWASLGKKGKMG